MINRVAARGTALTIALEIANTIADNAPLAVAASKFLTHSTATEDTWGEAVWQHNNNAADKIFASADAHEGARAFGEKRPPVWTGR